MSTLTQAAIFTKRATRWAIIGLILIITLIGLFLAGKRVITTIAPPGALPSTVAFGKLPKFNLAEGLIPPQNVTYQLETITGGLPQLDSEAKVFAILQSKPFFGALEELKSKAIKVKFSKEPVQISGSVVKFVDPETSGRSLTFDSLTGNFTLASNYFTDPKIITSKPRSLEEAIRRAQDFFQIFNLNFSDFPKDKIQTKFMRIDGGTLVETINLSSANLIQINFQRNTLDGLGVILPKEKEQAVWALVSEDGIVAAKLNIINIQKFKFATYPLKGTTRAFSDLQAGKAAFNKNANTNRINITAVVLGYVESQRNNQYLQPVYLFKGPENFIAYVPAIDDAWVEK